MGILADLGLEVIGIDIDTKKVEMIKNGESPIVEKGLDTLFQKNKDKIKASTNFKQIINTNITFICVGTPSNSDGSVDLSFVMNSARCIGKILGKKDQYHLVVLRSTVPPGASRNVIRVLENESGKKCGRDFGYCMNPEFLREGNAIKDFLNPSFTIIGEFDETSGDMLETFYKQIKVNNGGSIHKMSLEAAEIFKYLNNAFHAIKVAFANEVARLCNQFEVDAATLMKIFVQDTVLNISPYYLRPGYAFGGSCLPKDVRGILSFSEVSLPLVRSALESNQEHIMWSAKKIFREEVKNACVIGVSFKKGTGDIRESPYVALMRVLRNKEIKVYYYDPIAEVSEFKKINAPEDLYKLDLDVIIIGSGNGIKDLNLKKFKKIIDLQGAYKEKYKGLKTYTSLI